MSATRMTFGEHLKQFARSIDFIDQAHYDSVQHHIKKYLELQLGATQVALFERTQVDGQEGMTTVWSEPAFEIYQTLCDDDGEYRRQLALALGDSRNLWVLAENNESLSADNPGVDVWGECASATLPPFFMSPQADPSKTAIMMITRNARGRENGVLLTEIKKVVRPSIVLRNEMQLIADSVGLLHATDRATNEQREGTNAAISSLADLLRLLELETGPRPLMFVASSSRAPEDVLNAMEEVLEGFYDHVWVKHWGRIHRPGNINLQLVEEIRRSQYGICYLSEEVDAAVAGDVASTENGHAHDRDDEFPYRDNPNVLIEAGMLHIVTSADAASGTGWIPIRESESPPAPFDLGNQRTILVQREDGRLLEREFKDELKNKLVSLLGAECAGPVAAQADEPVSPVPAT